MNYHRLRPTQTSICGSAPPPRRGGTPSPGGRLPYLFNINLHKGSYTTEEVWVRVDPKIKAAKDKVKNKRYIRLHINLLYGYGQYFDGIYRDIDILSSATLAELHEAIFELFDRYDGHAWKFSFDTDNPYSREGRHYLPRFILEDMPDEGYAAEETTLDSLNLKDGTSFLYLFDFGDDWIHEITVLSSSEASPRARKIWKLVKKQGKSPDQYPEEDYEDE